MKFQIFLVREYHSKEKTKRQSFNFNLLSSFVLLSIGLRKYSSKLIKIFQLKRYNVVEVFLRGFSKRILRARRFVFLDGGPY